MVDFFPFLLPGEILYSVFARYHCWARNFSAKATLREIFSNPAICASVELPCNLRKLIEALPETCKITISEIVNNHTIFPLFRPFLPYERSKSILLSMSEKDGRAIYFSTGLMSSSVPAPKFLRYCSHCFIEDQENYGEPYWHRSHQITGVDVCSIHNLELQESLVAFPGQSQRHLYRILDKDSINLKNERFAGKISLQVAQSVEWILDNVVPILGLDQIKKRYILLLKKADLATFNGRVNQIELCESFRNYYSHDYLCKLGCGDFKSEHNWLARLVRSPKGAQHPIKHILLMILLGETPQSFFNYSFSNKDPFGQGPWPCLNPAASHYKNRVIETCIITRDSKTKQPVGTFTCNCGFTYSRRGPDQKQDDVYKIGRIKCFGVVWYSELYRLIYEDQVSLRAAARKLNVDTKTIKSQLQRMDEAKISGEKNQQNRHNLIQKYRNNWLDDIQINSNKSGTELRKINPTTYMWLYRNDKEWLMENTPKQAKRVACNQRVDWTKRDDEIVLEVEKAVKEIRNSPKPFRITKSSIGKHIKKLGLIQKHLDKLPKVKATLAEVTESVEEFRLRKCLNELEKKECYNF